MANHQSLIGLPWEYGKQDCYTLLQQYFALHGITLRDFERPSDLQLAPSMYMQELPGLGFKQIEFEDRQVGDVGLFRIGTVAPMHAAIFVEPWRILHQKQNSISSVEWLSSYYVKRIAAVYRYAAGSSAG